MSAMDGREVEQAWGTPDERSFKACAGLTAKIENEHHGEYDIDWIVVRKDGAEIYRLRADRMFSISWVSP